MSDRLAHYAAAALFALASPAYAALISVDPYHGPCTPEEALDAPETWTLSKGIRLAPTCTPYVERWDPEVFEKAKGASLTRLERGALFHRWHQIHDPDRELFGIEPLIVTPERAQTPAIPLPPALALLLGGFVLLLTLKRRKST